ncbi:phenylalanine--tRNA ligase subunit beta [Buchnera aphidicola (Diuraphis noxia)]|uniref:Phenylalanine--tRNA ligase beta subunit n=1 Tax=Buchnera aphidicola subsp. Diuraphis noxia TaxID=118101 RepID=A0A1B2H812_BUCDN|nr:phenylalanine--tRNA ligase subunit beta [Buchnera aphidicola]ANZ22363.1 phenylalanine--tRNA ligase subunit beta [Buchnera aphidicola (Diuraphis noxia)]
MKFSETWLREWINIKIDSNILYNQISSSGIEIEYVKKFEPIFNGIIVGKVIECRTHEKLNNLKIIKVDVGTTNILNIVCGASNCRYGIKVAVALVGSSLPKNIKIEKKILHGEISEGMLCSFFELGMFYTDKIIELPQDISIGSNVNDHLLLKDNIIKISTTSNRPDGLSILGLSRNIAALNNVKMSPLQYKSISLQTQKKIDIYVKSKRESINYFGRVIEDININVETPFWIKKKLFFSDILLVDVITDIIHYILIEIAQPLNVLDFNKIDDFIVIRHANNKENIFLKDNTKLHLNEKCLVISDKNKILSIPGNINSYIADINKNTKNIFLSSLYVNKKSISYIIRNIKSNQILEYYNYGIDVSLQKYAIEYATDLILKICGGKPGPIVEINHLTMNSFSFNKHIRLYYENLNKKVGCLIDSKVVTNILYNLDYQIICEKKYCDVIPPKWRFDILIEEDVIGDLLRIYRYDNIPLKPLKESLNFRKQTDLTDFLLDRFSIILINKGYNEIITYGFIDPKIHELMFLNKKKLLLSNPISQDMSCMRISLWPGLLKTLSYNKNRQQKNIRFFETGLCFSIKEEKELGVQQEMFLAAIISGDYTKENWCCKKRSVDFYDLKGDLECILESIIELDDVQFKHEIIPGLHPEQSASIYFNNSCIGSIGAVDPRLEKKLNVNSSTFLFEISLNNFSKIKSSLKIEKISKFPTSRRDLAILISKDIAVSEIINACKKFFINKKVEINLFDIYSGPELFNQTQSLGISFVFQNMKKNLKENEINLMIHDCIGLLKRKFQVILRK